MPTKLLQEKKEDEEEEEKYQHQIYTTTSKRTFANTFIIAFEDIPSVFSLTKLSSFSQRR